MFKKVTIVCGIACLLIFNINIRDIKAYHYNNHGFDSLIGAFGFYSFYDYNEGNFSPFALSSYYIPADRFGWIPNIITDNRNNSYRYSLSQPAFNQSLNPIDLNLQNLLNPMNIVTTGGPYLTSLSPIPRFVNSYNNLREWQNLISRSFYINNYMNLAFPPNNKKTDNEQCSCSCIIINENIAPIADAGIDLNAPVGSRIKLFGDDSIDLDGDYLLYNWSFISIPKGSNAILSDPTIISPSFIADTKGDYIIQLTVTDGKLYSEPDTIKVTADSHIIVSYHFDELIGNKAIDSSGNRFHGNIYNASWTDGKVGGALLFNGSDSQVSIPFPYSMDPYDKQISYFETQQMSIEAWIKLSYLDVDRIYLIFDSLWDYKLQINNGKLEFLITPFSGWKIITLWDEVLNIDHWYYIAITYNGYEARTYINGIEVDYNTIINPIKDFGYDTFIGKIFHGIIDEVRISNIALTPEEIYNYYLEAN